MIAAEEPEKAPGTFDCSRVGEGFADTAIAH
jgi:hypothetical protein